ncbi:MAG TPA: ChaN family lipoprotein [Kofleriaceae bacterium]|jgi:uncharacterized iron-regulated protein
MLRSLAIVALGACAGTYGGQPPAHPGAKPSAGIENAALPYGIVDARTGHAVETAAFWQKLVASRAVCVGEEHSNPHHHWVELEVAKHVLPSWQHGALGLEMIQRPFQGVLDDFAAKRIDEAALLARVGWEERWGYDFAFYGPTLQVAIAAHAALLALDASTELTKQVAHHGLQSLSADDRAKLPELDLANAAHRAWFDALMEDMGGSEAHSHAAASMGSDASGSDAEPMEGMPSADDIYAVQVIWDETMADTAATWLAAHPDGHILILAGTGHCHDSAIVGRLKRRGVADVVSVRAVGDDVADALAKPMNDFLVVLQMPPGTANARD